MKKTEAQEDEEKEPGRSTKGGQAILAGHRATRLRRGGSVAQYQAEKLEEIGRTATQPETLIVSSGEAIRESFPHGLRNTLLEPTVVAADASEHRSRLAADADVLEMAADAATTMNAQNSVEKMLAHQLALAHKMAMEFGRKALEEKEVVKACKLQRASTDSMRSYHQGVDSLHRGRRGGRQIVTVQRVNINEGAQAVIAANLHSEKR